MKTINIKLSLFGFVFCIFSAAFAQTAPPRFLADGNENGVSLIILENALHPDKAGDFEGYQIFRRSSGEGAFKAVSKKTLTLPSDAKTLVSKLGGHNTDLLMAGLKAQDTESLYGKVMQNDSLHILAYFDRQFGESFGLRWQDNTAKTGKKYDYYVGKVRKDGSKTAGENGQNAITVTAGQPKKALLPPTGLSAEIMNQKIGLSFSKDPDKQWRHIYRSTRLGSQFLKVSRSPLTGGPGTDKDVFSDSVPELGRTYFYMVATEDPFGNAAYGDTLEVIVPPGRILNPPFITKAENGDTGAELRWARDTTDSVPIAGFTLLRRLTKAGDISYNEPDSLFEIVSPRLIPANDSFYIDQTAVRGQYYRYKIRMMLPDGRIAATSQGIPFLYQGKGLPLAPSKVKATPMMGSVLVEWEASSSGDISGYQVFRGYANEKIPETHSAFLTANTFTFIDSAKTLSKKINFAYYVKAYSYSGKESILSKPVYASPIEPKVKPRAMNSLTGSHRAFTGYSLNWRMAMDDETEKVRLYRASPSDTTKWSLIYEEKVSEGKYLFNDTTGSGPNGFAYQIRPVSYDNLEGDPSVSLYLKPGVPLVQAPTGLIAKYMKAQPNSTGGITLSWLPVIDDDLKSFSVYRKTFEGIWEKVADIPTGVFVFEDKGLPTGRLYRYYVVSINREFMEGEPSMEVSIELTN